MDNFFVVTDAKRRKEVQLNNSLGLDIRRYLTELIINADDSYRRLESNNSKVDGRIFVIINEKKKGNSTDYIISVTDFAEGMSRDKLIEKFKVYGSDKAGGVEGHVTGMFGQGGSDVLRNACYEGKIAQIESIYDDKYTKMEYIKKDTENDFNFGIVPRDSIYANADLRHKLGIKKNGTTITFGVPQKVKASLSKLIKSGLREGIQKYPPLRYLLNNPKREVYIGKSFDFCEQLDSSKYMFFGETIYTVSNYFIYQGKKIPFTLKLFNRGNKNDDVTEIIVRDEYNAVYANTSFVASRYFRNIIGELEIKGLYKICYDAYNANPKNRQLLFDDDRTGFNMKNEFYKNLNRVLEPILTNVAESTNKENTIISINNKQLLSAINDGIKELTQEDSIGGSRAGKEPPASGIKFARSEITISKSKKYGLHLLINPMKVKPGDNIMIEVKDNYENVEVSPLSISYEDKDIKDGLVMKNVTITAIEVTDKPVRISASYGGFSTETVVTVTHLSIHYPENGLEIYPKDYDLVFDSSHIIKLYVDSEIVPLESIIEIKCPGLEGELTYKFTEEHIVADSTIGEINLIFRGGELGEKYIATASYGDLQTIANINLISAKEQSSPSKGYVSDIKFRNFEDGEFQAFIHPTTKVVWINMNNAINKLFLGDIENLDADDNGRSKEQKKYVCEILTTIIAREMIKEKSIRNGDINFEEGGEGVADKMWDIFQNFKNYMFNKLNGFTK